MLTTAPEKLREESFARIGDVDVVGVASVESAQGTPLFDSARALLPNAQSIVVVGAEVFAEVAELVVPGGAVGEAVARDLFQPHLDFLNGRLNRAIYELAKVYRGAGFRAIPLPSQGTPNDMRFMNGILSFKHAAQYAGLGSIGRSSLLITPKFGPRVRLACLLTDANIPSGGPSGADPCASCPGLCVDHCPAGALAMAPHGERYVINKFACYTFRHASGGCSTCLNVCPEGR